MAIGRRLASAAAVLMTALLLGGCATSPTAKTPAEKLDPWENWNRKVFGFNEKLDEKVLEPVATAYSNVVPHRVRKGVDNFFWNAADAWSAVNNFLQFKWGAGMHSVMRVGTNTLFGLGGLLDPATEMGLERNTEDFGKTLAHWGVGAGAYIVWPLYGPSTVRDSVALPLDRGASPSMVINDGAANVSITALQIINSRANFLSAGRMLDGIVLDKYTFVRDAYLQRRGTRLLGDDDYPDENFDYADPEEPAKKK
ncbi:VacJ family lipoprotein [Piscinibacter sakaiensis]|uniref:MlaA family lipoprotein n=1 Tax=Piscinibacter sakaiensis TaxID=1547922 RepID=UPI003AAB7ED1